VSWRGEFDRKFISRQICKRTVEKIVEKQKRAREKHVISRNSENHTFLTKDMRTKISTEQNPGNCYGLNPAKPPEFSPEIQLPAAARPIMVYSYRTWWWCVAAVVRTNPDSHVEMWLQAPLRDTWAQGDVG